MTWRSAFLQQARSDNAIRRLLNREKAAYSHQLHYLQMTAEKLAKGVMTPENSMDGPRVSHAALVRALQILRIRPDIRRQLQFASAAAFGSYIDSILPIAHRIERLAPNLAGKTRPNPEYPWKPRSNAEVFAPCDYAFADFRPSNVSIVRLVQLIESLLTIVS
jgi:hypothetical protein